MLVTNKLKARRGSENQPSQLVNWLLAVPFIIMVLLEMSEYLIYGLICTMLPMAKLWSSLRLPNSLDVPNTVWGLAIFGYAWYWEVASFLFTKDVLNFPLRWWLLWSFAPFVAALIAWAYAWLCSTELTYEMCLNVVCLLSPMPVGFYSGKFFRWLARQHK